MRVNREGERGAIHHLSTKIPKDTIGLLVSRQQLIRQISNLLFEGKLLQMLYIDDANDDT